MVNRFADYRFDVAARRPECRHVPVPPQARPFDLLVCLIRERGRVVPQEELQAQVWRDGPVSHAALAPAMTTLRQALATPDDGKAVMRPVPRAGWRFFAPLSEDADVASSGAKTVAWFPVENATGNAALARLERGLMAIGARDLEHHPVVVPATESSVMTALHGASVVRKSSTDAAMIRATGARTVLHGRVVCVRDGGPRLHCASRGDLRFNGRVAAERPTDLAARFAEAIAQAFHPGGAPASAATRRDPLTLMLQSGAVANRHECARARQIVARMYEQCEHSGDRFLPIAGLNFEAQALGMDGDMHRVIALSLEAARRAIESMPSAGGNPPDEHVWRAPGLLAAAEGRHAEAAEDHFRAVRLQRDRGQGHDEPQANRTGLCPGLHRGGVQAPRTTCRLQRRPSLAFPGLHQPRMAAGRRRTERPGAPRLGPRAELLLLSPDRARSASPPAHAVHASLGPDTMSANPPMTVPGLSVGAV